MATPEPSATNKSLRPKRPQLNVTLSQEDRANLDYLTANTPYRTQAALIRHLLSWHAKRYSEAKKGVTLLINRSGSIREIEL